MLDFSDYIIFFSWIWVWIIFLFIETSKIYKMFFWMIFWFLIFLVINYKIKLLEISIPINLSAGESILINNKEFFIYLSIFSIPFIWVLNMVSWKEEKDSPIISSIFWLLLPIFFIWVFAFIKSSSTIDIWFIDFIENSLYDSSIYNFFRDNLSIFIYLLFVILAWKILLNIIIRFLDWIKREYFTKKEEEIKEEE